jgi:hypothetical protein
LSCRRKILPKTWAAAQINRFIYNGSSPQATAHVF